MAHHRHDAVSRSRSPVRHERSKRSRSKSPTRHHSKHHHKHVHHHREDPSLRTPPSLPFLSRPLSKHDLSTYRPMFALYLDIQKNIVMEDLDEDEIRGRWKSFINKWNRGELAEGWYDPETLFKAQSRAIESQAPPSPRHKRRRLSPDEEHGHESNNGQAGGDIDEEEDFGPILPFQQESIRPETASREAGPAIPSLSDLQDRRVLETEATISARSEATAALRAERRADRKLQLERLDEMIPRAEAGTRERQLEKKQEKAAANKSFAEARGRSPEFRDDDLMGGGEDISDLKRTKKEEEREKNEREIRREEILRARTAEREERMKGLREKEEKTISMLKELAKARFGTGGQS